MAIIRWDPYRDLITLREKMNRLFEESYSSRPDDRDLISSTWTPSVDIYEKEKENQSNLMFHYCAFCCFGCHNTFNDCSAYTKSFQQEI